MTDAATQILVLILTSGVVSSAITFVARRYIERRLGSYFDEKLELIRHQNAKELSQLKGTIESAASASKLMFEKRFEISRSIADCVYRCRNLCRASVQSNSSPTALRAREELETLEREMRQLLVGAVLILSEELFEEVHAFKELVSHFLTLVSIESDREDGDQRQRTLIEVYAKIDAGYSSIVRHLRGNITVN